MAVTRMTILALIRFDRKITQRQICRIWRSVRQGQMAPVVLLSCFFKGLIYGKQSQNEVLVTLPNGERTCTMGLRARRGMLSQSDGRGGPSYRFPQIVTALSI